MLIVLGASSAAGAGSTTSPFQIYHHVQHEMRCQSRATIEETAINKFTYIPERMSLHFAVLPTYHLEEAERSRD